MIRAWVGFLLLAFSVSAAATELELLHQAVLPSKMKFKKTTIGGLSGLVLEGQTLFAISDDRGNVNEPRIYEFKLSITPKEIKVEPENVIFLTVNESSLSHRSTKSKAQIFSKVIDLEGISLAPWGDFLAVNEGDANKKPRVAPQLLNVKKDGTIVREFEVPSDFIPDPGGEQKKGVQNNLAFEGLALNPNNKEWLLATEGPLAQDASRDFVRFLQYNMPEAWVLKPAKEYRYPLTVDKSQAFEFRGISEIHFLDEKKLLVLERSVQLGSQGMKINVQIFETDLTSAGKDNLLSKKKLLDLSDLTEKIGKIENFEGMTLGPKLSDGRRSLILVSDDNFMRNQRTQFLLFAIKE